MLKVLYLLIVVAAFSCADVSDVRLRPDLYDPFNQDQFRPFGPPPFFPEGVRRRPNYFGRNVTLCTYSQVSYNKCLHTIHVAANQSIDLPLNCVQRANRDSCIQDVQQRGSDMVVLQEHDYLTAREQGLKPVLFAKETPIDYYIAVAPSNISLIEFNEAPLSVNLDIHRAFHSAVLFNLLRGRDICPQFQNTADSVEIRIIHSAEYIHSDDDILICLFGGYDATGDVASCNWEVSLQNAVFVSKRFRGRRFGNIKRIFDTIYREFGENAAANGFNFFDTFDGSDDVIFKNNTERFDLRPTYINGINEQVFNKLHCQSPDESKVQNVRSFWRELASGLLQIGINLLQ